MTGTQHTPTFCRICEPLCGMVATVEDGRLVALRPDKDHPLSAGFACQKGIEYVEAQMPSGSECRRHPLGARPLRQYDAGAALDRHVRTGLYCAYTPGGDDEVRWIVQS